ncbi:MAG TPA: glycoside hydrolase family 3 N-terminal domain-containing protein [Solirubrobacteraceae bacterium]|jgi:beta-glucosidase|nr:glycoside hydrolase family 3 N-terminal domain-containing protein [Solirubrobacteraceae bacterium]
MSDHSADPSAASSEAEPWLDTDVSADERVADLLGRMTLREKVAQLYGVWVGVDGDTGAVAPHQHEQTGSPPDFDELIINGLGQLTRPFGTVPVEPGLGAQALARSQRQIMAAGRFGIPAVVHEECLTGLAAWQATVWPSPLCWAASFDPPQVEEMARHIGQSMRRLGIHQGLAPVMDVVRDLRWGRVEETMGEDPHLVGVTGSAYVRGLEQEGIVATLKHFVGYSASRAGRNLAPVSIGPRELADVLLPPFEMALQAGARAAMPSYCDLDGLPAVSDEELLTTRLREVYGFAGTVVSDYFAIAFLESLHGVATGPGHAAAQALRAGVDVELPTVNCYGDPLVEAVERGDVDERLVDRAATRVLRQKCELGLLDPAWEPEPAVSEGRPLRLDDPESRRLAGELARRSIVLLRNEGVLPLRPSTRLAVVGPLADSPTAFFGCYSFPVHVGVKYPDIALGVQSTSVLDALRADPAGYDVDHAAGCPVVGGDGEEGIAAAAALAAGAEVGVLVLGDEAGLFGAGTSGEGCDAADLRLPGRQEQLLEAVLATGTPIVLVLVVGRPYDVSRQVDRLAAAICAFFPGEDGGGALADILSGRVNPSGRLPVSFPGAGSAQPGTYLASMLAASNDVSSLRPEPAFGFGHGLSYARAVWEEIGLLSPESWPTDGICEVAVTLTNPGDRATSEVVQVYLHDPVAEVVRPVRQLVGFARVELPPGARRRVRMRLHADLSSFTGRRGERIVEPGEVSLQVGASSADIRGVLRLGLAGPRRVVGYDRHRMSEIAAENVP